MNNLPTLIELFAEQVQKTPAATAIVCGSEQVTFQELHTKLIQIASLLQQYDVAEGDRVALYLPRNIDLIAAMLAIMHLGAIYVPLDQSYPEKRNQIIIQNSAAKLVLFQEQKLDTDILQVEVSSDDVESNPIASEPRAKANDIAYLIYTSGSTGTPKGVQISHANVCYMLNWAASLVSAELRSGMLASTSICFDLSVFEIFLPLTHGGSVYLVNNILDVMAADFNLPIKLINTVPSAIQELIYANAIPGSVAMVCLAGEALKQETVNALYANANIKQVYNLYAPSETTTYSTCHLCEKDQAEPMVPIGKAIPGTKLLILNDNLNPLPPLVKGEIYILGSGVTRGYYNNPAETEKKFIQHQVGDKTITLYKTGDLAKVNSKGILEYCGRVDNQIKIRGYRVELSEIETSILQQPAIDDVIVINKSDSTGSNQLIAFYKSEHDNIAGTLKSQLSSELPKHLIPAKFIQLEKFPQTLNGKVDRNALLNLASQQDNLGADSGEELTSLESSIAKLWSDVLDVSVENNQADFFELGGHSLLAARLASRIHTQFKILIDLKDVFCHQVLQDLAKFVDEQVAAGELITESMDTQIQPGITYPLSFAQQRLWFLEQVEKGKPISNIPIAIRINGDLNIAALKTAVQTIIARHSALRTKYVAQDGVPQQIIRSGYEIEIEQTQLDNAALLDSVLLNEAHRPFDLENDLLIRLKLIMLNSSEQVLMITQHHIASDAWSLSIFIRELSELYNAELSKREVNLGDDYLQYAAYSLMQNKHKLKQDQFDYWEEKLHNCPELTNFPTDHPREPVQSYVGAMEYFQLPEDLQAKLKSLAKANKVTLFPVLYSCFQILLQRYTNTDDLCTGILSANRDLEQVENSIGFFVNSLPIRIDFSNLASFKELLNYTQTNVLEALAHQNVPFDQLVEHLNVTRHPSHHPLFQVLFTLQNALEGELQLDGVELEEIEFDRKISKFDLTMMFVENNSKLKGIVEYSTGLFKPETIRTMIQHYINIMTCICDNPEIELSQVSLLDRQTSNQIMNDWNATKFSIPTDQSVISLFEQQVESTPNSIAVFTDSESLTYTDLNSRANQLAHSLTNYGVTSDMPVAVVLDRSIDAIISLLAILKLGAYYVPLDPATPEQRLSLIFEDAEIMFVVTNTAYADLIPSGMIFPICIDDASNSTSNLPQTNLNTETKADDLIYMMYTSGSTGKPKGVLTPNIGVVRLVKNTNYVSITPDDVFLQVSPLAFDGSTFEIWGALLNGASVCLLSPGVPQLSELANKLEKHNVSILFITTQLFNALTEHYLHIIVKLKYLLFGGEIASIDHVNKFIAQNSGCTLCNVYGPTETTTYATYYPITSIVPKDSILPIGKPIGNTQVYLLDENLQLVPPGIAGEIYIGGLGLAHGYLNRDDLTAEKFIQSPFNSSERLYRSGDLGNLRPDGNVEFLRRVDSQVKLRGYRIELEEVEKQLREIGEVLDAVVVLKQQPQPRLIAYLKTHLSHDEVNQKVIPEIKTKLPDYMVPSGFMILEQFPLNNNGKVDHKKLPEVEMMTTVNQASQAEHASQLHQTITDIWQQTLGHTNFSHQDNYFEVGGNSLALVHAAELFAKNLSGAGFTTIPSITDLFQYTTIQQLADFIGSASNNQDSDQAQDYASLRKNRRSRRRANLQESAEN